MPVAIDIKESNGTDNKAAVNLETSEKKDQTTMKALMEIPASEFEDAKPASPPPPPRVRPPATLEYKELAAIGRTMHFHDFQSCSISKQFQWSPITKKYRTVLPSSGKYIWFRAMSVSDTRDKHDWFGNVRCSIDLLDFLKQDPRVNMFLVDRSYFGHTCASRILLSYCKTYPYSRKLNLRNLKTGDPIMFQEGKLMFLYKDMAENETWWGNHQTEFVFDLNNISAKSLFKSCTKQAVSHSCANKKNKHDKHNPRQCLVFNSNRKSCPSPWDYRETQKKLEEDSCTNRTPGLQKDAKVEEKPEPKESINDLRTDFEKCTIEEEKKTDPEESEDTDQEQPPEDKPLPALRPAKCPHRMECVVFGKRVV